MDPRQCSSIRTALNAATSRSLQTSQTSKRRSARGGDYDALAGLAAEQEIRGLKELCCDQVTSLITGRHFAEG